MKPPTIDEVRAYIIEKGWTTVSAQEFLDVNEAGDWKDKHGRPYKYWKKVLATWYHNSLRYGHKPNYCRICRGYGVYTSTDDSGQQYWLCEDHKPRPRQHLPESLTDVCKAPDNIINWVERRTELIRGLKNAN